MTTIPGPTPAESAAGSASSTRKLVRGSSLLTFGRVIAVILKFVVQVITVRFLMKADYGAFAVGLAVASMGSSVAVFGLPRTLNRFAPLFQEKGEFGRMAGTVALSLCCVAGIGLGVVLLVFATRGYIGETLVHDPLTMSLIMILIFLAPLQALDSIFEEMFATFANPRALFIRRHLIGPLIKLAAVLPLMFAHANPKLLAVSYVIGGVFGTGYSMVVLWSVMKRSDLLKYFRRDRIRIPARRIFGFSVPLLSTDLLVIVRSSLVILLLHFCHGAIGVAAFRAVLPVARLNTFVADSFRLLFSPTISRMFARNDLSSIRHVYWRSMAWIAVATFPLFLICVSLSEFLTVTLFTSDYADSADILRLLAVGFYISAVVGFNNEVLKAYGHVGRICLTDIMTMATVVVLGFWLVPQWGAIGGAAATVAGLLIRPIGNQFTLVRLGLVGTVDVRCLRLFSVMFAVTIGAWLLPQFVGNSLISQLMVTIVGSIIVLWVGLPVLEIRETFPELMRYAPIRRLVGVKGV